MFEIIFFIVVILILYILQNNISNDADIQSDKKIPIVYNNYTISVNDFDRNLMIEQLKVQKDPPEIKNMKQILTDFTQNYDQWDCLITMGNIYAKGAFPRFLPNEFMAAEIFKLAAMVPNSEIAGLGQLRFLEVRREIIDINDKQGTELPLIYGEQLCALAYERLTQIPFEQFSKPKLAAHTMTGISNTTSYTTNRTVSHLPMSITNRKLSFRTDITSQIPMSIINREPTYRNELFTTTQRAEPIHIDIYSDSQNVHDHAVTNILKHNINNLEEEDNSNNDKNEIIQGIIDSKELKDTDKMAAIKIIDSLRNDIIHSTMNKSEKEVLNLVWNKIKNQNDPQIRNNLTETLGKQLASAIENGSQVCSTGKIARIMGTLDSINDDNLEKAKPIWAVKQEIGNLAIKIRNDIENEDEQIKTFEKEATDIYINKLGMCKTIIDPIIKEYKGGF